ncbi:hypothetical protein [Sinimarinibacterium thermocellulolyticum]|uniref:Uncharacterized protein n=1 Tax=Sinimarinibacterium thermocellulolyticum TaxID=3170016 RepID=A0ABV2A8C7_9GAMM
MNMTTAALGIGGGSAPYRGPDVMTPSFLPVLPTTVHERDGVRPVDAEPHT